MNRLLSILLIPLFVLGQALPHSHAGSGVAEPDDHAARPHWHLSGHPSSGHVHHEHGDHQHGDREHKHVDESDSAGRADVVDLSTPTDHDSDAVYLAQSDVSLGRLLSAEQPGTPVVCDLVEFCFLCQKEPASGCAKLLPVRPAKLPIYLLVGSLRL